MKDTSKVICSGLSKQQLIEENDCLRKELASARNQETRHKILSASINIGYMEWDITIGRPVNFSEEIGKILGSSLDSLYQQCKCEEDFFKFVHPVDHRRVRNYLKDFLNNSRSGLGVDSLDFRIVRLDGEVRHLRGLIYDKLEEEGIVVRTFCAIQDITGHQKSIWALEQSEQLYSSLFSKLPLGVLEQDWSRIKQGVDNLRSEGVEDLESYFHDNPETLRELVDTISITSANDALLKIYRAETVEAFIEMEEGSAEWWDERWAALYASEITALAGFEKISCKEIEEVHLDGSKFEGRFITRVVEGDEESWKRILTIVEDVSERKQRETELVEAKLKAEDASKAKSAFLSTMSHEIRTPMNGILGMAKLLEDTSLTDEQKDYLTVISRSGNSLLTIINDILDFSKLGSGKVDIEYIPYDLERVCHECLELVVSNAIDKNLEVIFDYPPNCPRHIMGDPTRARQVLVNLLGNAVKFTKEGHVLLVVKWESRELGDDQLRIEIKDTGPGLKADSLEHIFSEFSQADLSTTRNYGGTGLGLAITKKLVDLMEWEIDVDSVYGTGTTFSITGGVSQADPPIPVNATSLKGVRVLFVDDNKEHRSIFQRMLEHMGAEVTIESDPLNVIELLDSALQKGTLHDIVILDQDMPVKSGFDLGVDIRKSPKYIAVKLLVFSLSGKKEDVSLFKKAGFNAYLSKLCRYEVLRTMLTAMLNHTVGQPIITQHSIEDANQFDRTENTVFEASILLVEDLLPNQIIAKKFLTNLGVSVDVASNGTEAVEAFSKNNYDLIFMDCRMPVMDGYDATRAVRLLEQEINKPPTPVIALTASVTSDDRILCEKAGMDDIIAKPFRQTDLSVCLKQWL